MTNENETGVKVPKGQINYNTVAGSLGLAAFAGLGLKNWFGGVCGNNQVAGTAAFAESQFVSSLMSELAKEKSERYADSVGINTFKEALALVKEERETRQANDRITFETLARLDKESALNKQDIECFKKEVAREFLDVRGDLKSAIALEAERRKAADDQIFDYGQCNYVRYIKKIDATQICPVVEIAARAAGPAVPDPNATTPATNA
jgi:hypothetical protein